jgi:hypothetical protein
MSCKARIRDKELRFPNVSEVFYTSTECQAPSAHSVKHEDGESSMPICKKCLKIHMKQKAEWLGWFDDVFPKDSPVKGSQKYRQMVKQYGEPSPPKEPLDLTSLKDALPIPEIKKEGPPIPSLSSLQTIETCKEARLLLKAWIRGEGAKRPGKLQPYYKADMDISAKMKTL